MRVYMFDTNVFNHLLERQADISAILGKARFVATHVQVDELRATKDVERRDGLLAVFEQVLTGQIPTETFVVGVSRLDEARLGGENVVPTESRP